LILIKLNESGLITAKVIACPGTESFYVDHVEMDVPLGATHYRNGVFLTKPPQPSPSHKWNDAEFVWEADNDLAWVEIRKQREARLKTSDWTQLPDVPLTTKEAWATYRQALRDITSQPDPFNIIWPVAP
jgi:hypothetical protein